MKTMQKSSLHHSGDIPPVDCKRYVHTPEGLINELNEHRAIKEL